MNGQPLVKSPEASEFFVSAATNTGRKVLLGDREKMDQSVYNAIGHAHEVMTEGITKITALADDPTRTEVNRHAAARIVAEKTKAALTEVQTQIAANAARLQREASAIVDEQFGVDPNRASLQSEIRGWIREQAAKEKGLQTIRDAMNEDREVAAVIYHSQSFLLGLAKKVREGMAFDAIEKHLPRAYKMLLSSIELYQLAERYPKAIAKVDRSFYNKALAAQASRRVEV